MTRDVIGACPLDCPDACSWVVTVDDEGRAVKLRGNPEHPHTRGGLCVKVNPYLEFGSDPSRLLHPMKRVGPKGERLQQLHDRRSRVRQLTTPIATLAARRRRPPFVNRS